MDKELSGRKAIINVQNKDNECFKWSVVRALNPVKKDPKRITKELREQAKAYDWSDIPFPTPYGDTSIKKFEIKYGLKINAYGFTWEFSEDGKPKLLIFTLRKSDVKGRKVNLFYVRKEGKEGFEVISHYCVIKSLSRLLSSTVRKDNNGKIYPCDSCLYCFKSQEDLDKHVPCMSTTYDKYPEPGTVLKFINLKNTTKVPFIFVFDFESFLNPINETFGTIENIQEHIPSAFALHCISRVSEYQPEPTVRVKTIPNQNIVIEFSDKLKEQVHEIHDKFKDKKPLKLTEKETLDYRFATECWICNKPFQFNNSWKYKKVRDHCHFTGEFKVAAHNTCNLRIQNRTIISAIAFDVLLLSDLWKVFTEETSKIILS